MRAHGRLAARGRSGLVANRLDRRLNRVSSAFLSEEREALSLPGVRQVEWRLFIFAKHVSA